ncbi:hypothetical protein GCM10022221_19420 [Actinocorallia aurea]
MPAALPASAAVTSRSADRQESRMPSAARPAAAPEQPLMPAADDRQELRMPSAEQPTAAASPVIADAFPTAPLGRLAFSALAPNALVPSEEAPVSAKPDTARRSGKKTALKRADRRAASLAQRSRGNARTLPTRRMNNRAGR